MKIDVQHVDSTRKKVRVHLPSEQVREKRDSVFRSMLGQAKVKGFRKGKVPREIFESMYGEEINQKTVSDLVSETLGEALLEKSLSPVNRPEITEIDEIVLESEFSYSVEFEVMPEFELADYSSIPVKKKVCKVSDEDVKKMLEKLRQDAAQLQLAEKDRLAKEGDYVKILFTATLEDGSVIRKDSTMDMVLGGENPVMQTEDSLSKEFTANLIGKKTGETTQFTTNFQEDFQAPKLTGKAATFYVTIKEIYDRTVPELDDDFAKNIGRQDMGELREALRQQLESSHEKLQRNSMMDQLMEHLVKSNPFDLPSSFVETNREKIVDNIIAPLKERGLGSDEIEAYLKWKEPPTDMVADILKIIMILHRIADKEGVDVRRFEIDDEIRKVAYLRNSDPQELLKICSKDQGVMENIENDIIRSKVLDLLLEKASIEEVDPEQPSIDNEQSSQ